MRDGAGVRETQIHAFSFIRFIPNPKGRSPYHDLRTQHNTWVEMVLLAEKGIILTPRLHLTSGE